MFSRISAGFALTIVALGITFSPLNAQAMGAVDSEAGLMWWAHEIDAPEGGGVDADDIGVYLDLWFGDRWGFSANVFSSDPDDPDFSSSSNYSIDVKRRLISPTENNFLAVGAGWQGVETIAGQTSDGPRLMIEGRVGAGILFGYSEVAWMPDLGDAGPRRDMDATEYEVGVSLTPFPFLNLRFGYREFDLEFQGGSEKSSGPLLGVAIHF